MLVITVCCKILPKLWGKIPVSSCSVAFLLIVIALNAKKKKNWENKYKGKN